MNPPPVAAPQALNFRLRLLRMGFRTVGRVFPSMAAKLAFRIFSTPRLRAKHRQSDDIIERARVFELLFGGIFLKCYEWGNAAQPTILLIHGWESRGTALRSFVPDLLAKGFRVVTFDGPAHGDSGGKRTHLLNFAGAIKAIFQNIGEVEGVVAHSFGGSAVAYSMAYIAPSIRIKKLVLIAAPASVEKMFENYVQLIAAPSAVASELKKLGENRIQMPLANSDLIQTLGKINVSHTLLIHDREDDVVPFRNAEAIAARWEHIYLFATRGFGHFRLVKNPEVIAKVVDFLTL